MPRSCRLGEAPRAYVVLEPESEMDEEEIFHYVKENAAPYKQLVGGIEILDAIPKSTAGKILRKELLAKYKQQNGLK